MKKKSPKTSSITMEQMKANGWKIGKDPVVPAKKSLGKDSEIGSLDLILHNWNNTPMFALALPGGDIVNINPASIEELIQFEKMILSYEPVW